MKRSPNQPSRVTRSRPSLELAPLSPPSILRVWIRGRRLHPVDRALTLLAGAAGHEPDEDLAALSLGERNAKLFSLREATFGPRLDGLADCPECAEQVEFTISTTDLNAHVDAAQRNPPFEFELSGRTIGFRLLNSYDLAAAAQCGRPDQVRTLLARRCLIDDAERLDPAPEVIDHLSDRLTQSDPWAETLLDLSCPNCGHAWPLLFDIASYFWSELSAAGRRLLSEVDALARAYSWREDDILAMSSERRHLYLELVS